MKKWSMTLMLLILAGFVAPAFGAQIDFHGDFNNRAVYSNHMDFLKSKNKGVLNGSKVEDYWVEFRYRPWIEVSTNDGNVKGVYAVEAGTTSFGNADKGGDFSGDGINLETRWAYTDIQLPFMEHKSRVKIGLQPINLNFHLWKEAAAGISWDGSIGGIDYQLAWMRGYEIEVIRKPSQTGIHDNDGFWGRINFKPTPDLKTGLFALYQTGDPDLSSDGSTFDSRSWEVKLIADTVKMDIYTLGLDGAYKKGPFFMNYDLMYQGGTMGNVTFEDYLTKTGRTGDFDLNAFFGQLDVGVKLGKAKITYRLRYASGDDDPTDNDFNAFIATDVDDKDPFVLSGDAYADAVTFAEAGYILDKGFILNALKMDYKATSKLKYGVALMYLLSAEDLEYTAALNGQSQSSNELGIELSGYVSYKLYKNVEVALNAGYQFSGDAMDAFETDDIQDGSADEDIFVVGSKLQLKF
jgi:hypothetical protein